MTTLSDKKNLLIENYAPSAQYYMHSQLQQRLLQYLKDIVVGNHVSEHDVNFKRALSRVANIFVVIDWRLHAKKNTWQVAGRQPATHHFNSHQGYANHVAEHQEQVYENITGYLNFLKTKEQLGTNILSNLTNTVIHRYETASYYYPCNPCNSSGKIICQYCRGSLYVNCHQCNGSGRIMKSVAFNVWNAHAQRYDTEHRMVQEMCINCMGSGSVPCRSCSAGYVTCNHCAGHGIFTQLGYIEAVVTPEYVLEVEQAFEVNKHLHDHLSHLPIGSLNDYLQPQQHDWSIDVEQSHGIQILYLTTPIEYIEFIIKDKEYFIYAFGLDATPFTFPHFFDDIFADEIVELKKLQHGKKMLQLKKLTAQLLFHDYCKQPVLNRSMQKMSELSAGQQDRMTITRIVQYQSRYFISVNTAQQLAIGILALFNRLSPQYLHLPWLVILSIPLLLHFIYFATWIEKYGLMQLLGSIGSLMVILILGGIVILVAMLVAVMLSKLIVTLLEQRIPKMYRRKGRHFYPFKYWIWSPGVVVILGIFYGVLSQYGFIPALTPTIEAALSSILGRFVVLH